MTGSALAPVVIPLVTVPVLFLWMMMMFYADSHPRHWHATTSGSEAAPGAESPAGAAPDAGLTKESPPTAELPGRKAA